MVLHYNIQTTLATRPIRRRPELLIKPEVRAVTAFLLEVFFMRAIASSVAYRQIEGDLQIAPTKPAITWAGLKSAPTGDIFFTRDMGILFPPHPPLSRQGRGNNDTS
jgi:hypothetical protein